MFNYASLTMIVDTGMEAHSIVVPQFVYCVGSLRGDASIIDIPPLCVSMDIARDPSVMHKHSRVCEINFVDPLPKPCVS